MFKVFEYSLVKSLVMFYSRSLYLETSQVPFGNSEVRGPLRVFPVAIHIDSAREGAREFA